MNVKEKCVSLGEKCWRRMLEKCWRRVCFCGGALASLFLLFLCWCGGVFCFRCICAGVVSLLFLFVFLWQCGGRWTFATVLMAILLFLRWCGCSFVVVFIVLFLL